MNPIIKLEGVSKSYPLADRRIVALHDVTLEVEERDFVAVMGPSGSGKSTLLSLIGGLDQPTAGSCTVAGQRLDKLDDQALARFRNRTVGFVFQSYNLIKDLTNWENVALPLYYAGVRLQKRRRAALELLRSVGLEERANHFPSELSGGEEQRVAIARALVNNPAVVLADEPTGNLDTKTSRDMMALLGTVNARGTTIIIVTHNPAVAETTKRLVEITDGKVCC